MRALLRLALQSAWNRRFTLFLVLLSIALSTILLVGLERVRGQARSSFVQAIAGTDLVVGARGSSIQLILYAVFHLGGATNNMGYDSYKAIAADPKVAWTIPLSMGDSHKGYPVVGTDGNFFIYFRHRRDSALALSSGRVFGDIFEAVVGSEVAQRLGYKTGDSILLSHGSGEVTVLHGDKPFTVVGVLAPTGSPVDRSIYVTLESMEAIHVDWRGGAPIRGFNVSADDVRKFNLEPKAITALLVGLQNRRMVFNLQREIQDNRTEALSAVMPGVALDQLWGLLGNWEKALLLVSLLVTFTGLAGLSSTILAGLGERRRELAILRSTGAAPRDIVCLLAFEGLFLTLGGLLLGLLVLTVAIWALAPFLLNSYGVALYLSAPTAREWAILGGIILLGSLTSLIPAFRAYFMSLSDGLGPSN
ncbi:MAG: ABC transporter permease [Deltaproteobacteria bacterium]|nr:ABC transporter permease [Deltaproteobacteria bacterium]